MQLIVRAFFALAVTLFFDVARSLAFATDLCRRFDGVKRTIHSCAVTIIRLVATVDRGTTQNARIAQRVATLEIDTRVARARVLVVAIRVFVAFASAAASTLSISLTNIR